MLDSFRHFVLVAEHKTLTAAAAQAHVTQPAMTLSLQRLEAELGARLFVRTPKGAELTEAGRVFLPRARAALAAVSDAKRAVSELAGLVVGVVRLGAGATVCTYYLPRLLARFRRRHPHVQICVREATTDVLEHALEGGEIDLAILAQRGRGRGDLFGVDELVLVCAPSFARGARKKLRITDDTPFVTFPRGATTRELLDERFPRANVVMELGGIAAIKSNVRAGVGVALVSRRAVERDVEAGTLVVIAHPETPIRRNLTIAHRGVERLPPAAAALRRLLLRAAPSELVASVRTP
jgi:DNA-binding transcriptional LysR family regulator